MKGTNNMMPKLSCSIYDVECYINEASAEDVNKVQDLINIRKKRLELNQYEEQLNNILNEIRALGYNIFIDNWFEEAFDKICFGIQGDDPMDICIDFRQ